MNPEGVRKALLKGEDKVQEIRLNDGTSFFVRGREQWLAAAEYLIVLDRKGDDHNIAYRNIAFIGPRPRGRRRRA